MKLLVIADPQYGAGADLGPQPWDRLADQDAVGVRAAEIAHEHGVDAVLFAGDIGERRKPVPRENVAIASFFRRFAPIPVLAIPGNHDIAEIDGPCSLDVFAPEFITLARTAQVIEIGGAAVACLPHTSVARLVASQGGGDRADINRLASGLLISAAKGLRAECAERFPDLPPLLLGHWGIEGAATESGIEITQLTEPWLPLADLEALGFALVAFGHIHPPKLLSALTAPPVISIGAPMQLKFGEHGERGVWIFDTETGATEFVPILSRMFSEIEYDPDEWPHIEFAEAMCMDAIVKVSLHVTAEQNKRIDRRKLTAALYEAGAWKVMPIIPDVERETRARVEGVDETLDEMEALDAYIKAQGVDAAMAERMRVHTRRYLQDVGS